MCSHSLSRHKSRRSHRRPLGSQRITNLGEDGRSPHRLDAMVRLHPRVLIDISPPVYADAVAIALRSGGYHVVIASGSDNEVDAAITSRESRRDSAPIVLCLRDTGQISVFESDEMGMAYADGIDQVIDILDGLLERPGRHRRHGK